MFVKYLAATKGMSCKDAFYFGTKAWVNGRRVSPEESRDEETKRLDKDCCLDFTEVLARLITTIWFTI